MSVVFSNLVRRERKPPARMLTVSDIQPASVDSATQSVVTVSHSLIRFCYKPDKLADN